MVPEKIAEFPITKLNKSCVRTVEQRLVLVVVALWLLLNRVRPAFLTDSGVVATSAHRLQGAYGLARRDIFLRLQRLNCVFSCHPETAADTHRSVLHTVVVHPELHWSGEGLPGLGFAASYAHAYLQSHDARSKEQGAVPGATDLKRTETQLTAPTRDAASDNFANHTNTRYTRGTPARNALRAKLLTFRLRTYVPAFASQTIRLCRHE